jgi:hypothetical protein
MPQLRQVGTCEDWVISPPPNQALPAGVYLAERRSVRRREELMRLFRTIYIIVVFGFITIPMFAQTLLDTFSCRVYKPIKNTIEYEFIY